MNSTQKPFEAQQDLFGDNPGAPKRPERFPGIPKSHKPILFATSAEHLIFLSILTVLAASFAFYLGILRGKTIAHLPSPTAAVTTLSPAIRVPGAVPAAAVPTPPQTAPATAALSAVPAAKTPSKDKPYTIQLSSYKKKEWADAEAAALRRMGYTTLVSKSSDYYGVSVGQYAGKDDAKRDLKALSSRYKDCYLRRR